MKKMSFPDRQSRILQIATTTYHSSDDAAQDYLAAMEGSTVDEQKMLFRLILGTHATCKMTHHKCPTKQSIPPNVWQDCAMQLQATTRNWAECAMRDNAPLDETADTIWDQLTLCGGGKDRIVALGLLLDSNLVPYAQIPKNLLTLKPRHLYDNAGENVRDLATLLMRIENIETITTTELAVAMVRILGQIDTHEEKVAFLLPFLEKTRIRLARGAMAETVLNGLGEVIYQDFLRQYGNDNQHDEN